MENAVIIIDKVVSCIVYMTGIKADTQTVFFVNPIVDHFQFLKSAPNLAPFASHCLKGNDYIIIISIQNHI